MCSSPSLVILIVFSNIFLFCIGITTHEALPQHFLLEVQHPHHHPCPQYPKQVEECYIHIRFIIIRLKNVFLDYLEGCAAMIVSHWHPQLLQLTADVEHSCSVCRYGFLVAWPVFFAFETNSFFPEFNSSLAFFCAAPFFNCSVSAFNGLMGTGFHLQGPSISTGG